MVHTEDNVVYVIDSGFKFVGFNETMSQYFPGVQVGDCCHKVIAGSDTPCAACPVLDNSLSRFTVYSKTLGRFMHVSRTKLEGGIHKDCTLMIGNCYSNIEKALMSRLRFLPAFDYYLEINLTKDKYRYLDKTDTEGEVVYNEESFSSNLNRLMRIAVNPKDQENFMNFWDLETLERRMDTASVPLSFTYREKCSLGSWDEVTVTLIPETYVGTDDKIILALFSVKGNDRQIKTLDSADEIDVFSGLFTERGFEKRVYETLVCSSESNFVVVAMDIEHFRMFNKWYGRREGDKLLKSISVFLLEMDRMFDTVSCYAGGDNYFIAMADQPVIIDYLIKGISDIMGNFDGVEGFRMAFGAARPEECRDIHDTMDSATTALGRNLCNYQEKISWYDKSMVEEIEHELTISPEVEKALVEKEFTFYLQPKYSVSEKRIVGSEALVRWTRKTDQMIPPGEFIPIIEKNGLVTRVDMYIWEQVCKTIRSWMDKGIELAPVSVNVSRVDIAAIDVPEFLNSLIEKYQIDRKYLEIEITESAFVEDTKHLKEMVQKLRTCGFTVLIDDFGSGYSSLNMLKDVQADVLKMDIKFFDLDNTNYDKGVDIIESVLNMSRKMKLSVIAEGVETEEQIRVIKDIGLNYVQGFYFYKPMSVEEYEKMMKKD